MKRRCRSCPNPIHSGSSKRGSFDVRCPRIKPIGLYKMAWNCPKCRESVNDELGVCWNCGTAQDGTEDPDFRRAEPETATPKSRVRRYLFSLWTLVGLVVVALIIAELTPAIQYYDPTRESRRNFRNPNDRIRQYRIIYLTRPRSPSTVRCFMRIPCEKRRQDWYSGMEGELHINGEEVFFEGDKNRVIVTDGDSGPECVLLSPRDSDALDQLKDQWYATYAEADRFWNNVLRRKYLPKLSAE